MAFGWILLAGYAVISVFVMLVIYAACVAASKADAGVDLSLRKPQGWPYAQKACVTTLPLADKNVEQAVSSLVQTTQ